MFRRFYCTTAPVESTNNYRYGSDLERMKEFYVDKLRLEFVSEQSGRHVFLKTEKICYSSSILN